MPQTILEKTMDELNQGLDVRFLMEEATLKKGFRRLKFSVGTSLQKSVRFYRINLYFDREPYLAKIRANESIIEGVESEVNLFNTLEEERTFRDGKTANIKKDIEKTKDIMDNLEETCEPFEFTGEAEKVEYNKETLTLRVDKETLDFINRQYEMLQHYRMCLKPII